jgi:hypothetical protein
MIRVSVVLTNASALIFQRTLPFSKTTLCRLPHLAKHDFSMLGMDFVTTTDPSADLMKANSRMVVRRDWASKINTARADR